MAKTLQFTEIAGADSSLPIRADMMNRIQHAGGRSRRPTPDSSDDALITDEEAAALARTIPNLFRKWALSDSEARVLLGGMSQSTWSRWKKGNAGHIGRDLRMRMAHLIGIHMGLRTIFREPESGYTWIRDENDFFDGASALDVMLGGEMSDLQFMRQWIDAEISA